MAPRILLRFTVLLLIPALLLDPATAQALRLNQTAQRVPSLTSCTFAQEALADKALGMVQLITRGRERLTLGRIVQRGAGLGRTLAIASAYLLTTGASKLTAQEIEIPLTPEYRHVLFILFLKIAGISSLVLMVVLLVLTPLGKDLIRQRGLHRKLRQVIQQTPALERTPVTAQDFALIERGVYRIPTRPTAAILKTALTAYGGVSQAGFYRAENQWLLAVTAPNVLEHGLPGDFSPLMHEFLFQFQSHTHPQYPDAKSTGEFSSEQDLDGANTAWEGYNHVITAEGIRQIKVPRLAGRGTFWETTRVYAEHMKKQPIPRDVVVNADYIRRNFEEFQADEWRLKKMSWDDDLAIENLLADIERNPIQRFQHRAVNWFHRWIYEPVPNLAEQRRQWRLKQMEFEAAFWRAIPSGIGMVVNLS